MRKLRNLLALYLLLTPLGCSVLTEDPWGWLADPVEQSWRHVEIYAVGRRIEVAVPDRMKSGGSRTQYWSDVNESEYVSEISLPVEDEQKKATLLSRFEWDAWWGGFYKKGGEDFYLSVNIFRRDPAPNLLGLSLEQRIEWTFNYWESKFLRPSDGINPNEEYFLEHFWLKPFKTESGLYFVRHNAPTGSNEHQHFIVPISDHHILDFTFFVNKLRYDTKEDPEWNQSRWELVEKIMKTVRITPDPFGNQPEELLPH